MTAGPAARPPTAAAVPNVRRFLVGQGISNVGTFFQIVAQSLLVLDLTGSGLALGAAMGVQFLPMLFFGPLAGVAIDRVRIPRLLTVTALCAGAEALTLGLLTSTGHINVAWILSLSFLLGMVQVADRSAAQVFLTELVERPLLPSAVGLSAVAQSVGRLGGPALAAGLYAWKGAAPCFYFNAASYVAVVVSLLVLRRDELIPRQPVPREPGQLRDGLRFAWRSPLLRTVLLANAAIGMLTFNFPAFYSSLVKLTFHGGATGFGVAESLNAITAVLGGFFLARRLHHPTMRLMALGCALLGVSMLWSAISPTLGLFLAGMPFFGAVVVVYTTVTQSLLQQHTPAEKQGRIMSLYMLGTMGTTPIGGLITGWITDQWSPRASLAVAGFTPLVCAAVVLTRSNALRPTALAG